VKILTAALRLRDAHRVMRSTAVGRTGILHVHYATAALSYATVRTPLVVHCHGTDVRGMSGAKRRVLGPIFRKAALVFAATPDLCEYVPEAVYLPNPVDTERFRPSETAQHDVLVFAALTDIKGGDQIASAVAELRRRVPTLSVTALDVGRYARELRAAGARMLPPQDAASIPDLIASHKVVIGQQRIGALGVSELQALASGRPTICYVELDQYGADAPPVQSSGSAEEIVRFVVELLGNEERRSALGARGREWIERVHALDVVTDRLLGYYRDAGILADRDADEI
jgi:glycosyltransferase involved in cell wall biosynthesis